MNIEIKDLTEDEVHFLFCANMLAGAYMERDMRQVAGILHVLIPLGLKIAETSENSVLTNKLDNAFQFPFMLELYPTLSPDYVEPPPAPPKSLIIS